MPARRSQIERVLTQAWTRRGPLAWVLLPVSFVFGALIALRRALYRTGLKKSTAVGVPVIVVGNVFVGGTGKTPLTIWLVEHLRSAGYVPGVISRGYGSSNQLPQAVTSTSMPNEVGDEPVLIAERARCPVVVGRDRVAAARELIVAYPDVNVIVSDDGLQHYGLQREIEIILFDARYVGNGWLLPAGPLRESAARPRDFTIVNAAQLPAAAPAGTIQMLLTGDRAELLSDRSRSVLLSTFAVSESGVTPPRIVAAAGIGNPTRFFNMLRQAGLIFNEMPLTDHYDFAQNPFADVRADVILITEKDAVKCSRIAILEHDPRLWVVPVTARIDDALAEKIVEKLRGHPTA